MNVPLDVCIEALLFFKAEPFSLRRLASLLGVDEAKAKDALGVLEEKLKGRGLTLLFTDDTVELRTAAEVSPLIQRLVKDELDRPIGKAGIETLAIILYRGPSTRREIDYIRGVNSSFILRTLLIRGLVERVPNPKDERSFLYRSTAELLGFLGLRRIEELQEFEAVRKELSAFESGKGTKNLDVTSPSGDNTAHGSVGER